MGRAELGPIVEAAARDGRNAAVLPFLRLLLHPMVDFAPTDPLEQAARNPDNRGPYRLRAGDPTPFLARWRASLRAVGAPD